MLEPGFQGTGQSLQCQPGGQLYNSPNASGHYISTPSSSGTLGIFDLFLPGFGFASQSYRYVGQKQVGFLQLEFSYNVKQIEDDLSFRILQLQLNYTRFQ